MQTNLDIPSISAETQPEQAFVAESAGVQTRSGEDDTAPDQDDPALNMRAGLIVNGVSFNHKTTFPVGQLLAVAVRGSLYAEKFSCDVYYRGGIIYERTQAIYERRYEFPPLPLSSLMAWHR